MKVSLVLIMCICLVSFRPGGETDYSKVFGKDYAWAVEWLQANDALFREYALAFDIPARELKAIIFPELIRYNGFINALEVESLKFLYINEGKNYADFSVGYFQMKPSFAEMIEVDAAKFVPSNYLQTIGWNITKISGTASRKQRVQRLSDTRHQLVYLCAFYKFCESRFNKRHFTSAEERVRLFATCYNAGYRRNYESLLRFQARKDFFNYNYSSVCASYYRQS